MPPYIICNEFALIMTFLLWLLHIISSNYYLIWVVSEILQWKLSMLGNIGRWYRRIIKASAVPRFLRYIYVLCVVLWVVIALYLRMVSVSKLKITFALLYLASSCMSRKYQKISAFTEYRTINASTKLVYMHISAAICFTNCFWFKWNKTNPKYHLTARNSYIFASVGRLHTNAN